MTHVLVIGDIVTDIVAVHSGAIEVDSDTEARIRSTGGGAGANTAAWLAYAGTRVSLLGVVGDDADGASRVAELTAAGVDCSLVRRTRESATGAVIVLSDGAHRTMITDRGANHLLTPSDVDDAFARRPDLAHLHLSGYTLLDGTSRPAGLRALAVAGSRGVPCSVDVASAAPLARVGARTFLDWVAGADLLFANADEARVLGRFDGELVVKRGDAGATWHAGERSVSVAAVPARVVDTTGAGDAFAAGLLAARLAGAGAEEALRAGAELGALAVGLVGGRPPTPRGR